MDSCSLRSDAVGCTREDVGTLEAPHHNMSLKQRHRRERPSPLAHSQSDVPVHLYRGRWSFGGLGCCSLSVCVCVTC